MRRADTDDTGDVALLARIAELEEKVERLELEQERLHADNQRLRGLAQAADAEVVRIRCEFTNIAATWKSQPPAIEGWRPELQIQILHDQLRASRMRYAVGQWRGK